MALQHFTKESFDQALNGGQLMMVDFWANWCMPCRMLGPVIQQLADQYDGRAVVGKVDVDAEGELAMRYGVMNIPTVILFKNGREIDRKVGVMPGPGRASRRRWRNSSPPGPAAPPPPGTWPAGPPLAPAPECAPGTPRCPP